MSAVHEHRHLVELETGRLLADRLAESRVPRLPSPGAVRRRHRAARGLRRLADRLDS